MTYIRIIAIIQLCFVFSLLSWYMSYPFMGQLFALKSKKYLALNVTGQECNADREKMERNKQRFNSLPLNQQTSIQRYLDEINLRLNQSFSKKLMRSIHILAFEISTLERMWIVFSLLIPLLFLMNFDTAKQIAYVLPLITFCYALDNHWNGYRDVSKEAALFPTEETIVSRYLSKPLSGPISRQQSELALGWQLYLIDQWAHDKPSADTNERLKQVETGEHRFLTARVLAQATQPPQAEMYTFQRQQSLPILLLFLLWNLFFAWFTNKSSQKIARLVQ
jgi:hypothetical protein